MNKALRSQPPAIPSGYRHERDLQGITAACAGVRGPGRPEVAPASGGVEGTGVA
jgi:hypothetical protein